MFTSGGEFVRAFGSAGRHEANDLGEPCFQVRGRTRGRTRAAGVAETSHRQPARMVLRIARSAASPSAPPVGSLPPSPTGVECRERSFYPYVLGTVY